MSDEKALRRGFLKLTGAWMAALAGCGGNQGGESTETPTSTATRTDTPTRTPTPTDTPSPTPTPGSRDLSGLGVFEEEVRSMLSNANLIELPGSVVESAQRAYLNGNAEEAIRRVANETMKRSGPGSFPPYANLSSYHSTAGAQAARNIFTYLSQGTPPGEAGPNDFAETKQFLKGETAEGFQKPQTPEQYLGIDPQGPNLSGIPDVKRVFIQGQMTDILTYEHHSGGDYVGFAPRPGEAATHRLGTEPETEYQESLAALTDPNIHGNTSLLDYEASKDTLEKIGEDVNIEKYYRQTSWVEGDAVLGPRSGVQRNQTRTPLLFTEKGFKQLSKGTNRYGLLGYPIEKLTENVVGTQRQEGEIYVVGEDFETVAREHDFAEGRPTL